MHQVRCPGVPQKPCRKNTKQRVARPAPQLWSWDPQALRQRHVAESPGEVCRAKSGRLSLAKIGGRQGRSYWVGLPKVVGTASCLD